MIINKKLLSITLSSTIGLTLAGCGGSSSSDEVAEEILSGIAITANNADEIIDTGLIDTHIFAADLLNLGNDVDPKYLEIESSTGFSTTYNCDTEGTITVTEEETTTTSAEYVQVSYDNCVQNDVHYHGDATVQTQMQSGSISNLGSFEDDWSAIQYSTLTNLERTEPVSNGVTNLMNGDITIISSNDTSTSIFEDQLTSSNLSFDIISSDASESSYDFSNLSYRTSNDYSDDSYQLGLDFVANHSSMGEVQLISEPMLYIESDILEEGTIVFTTGTSSLKLDAIGNDNIDVSLDVNNDATYDVSLPSTTWFALSN